MPDEDHFEVGVGSGRKYDGDVYVGSGFRGAVGRTYLRNIRIQRRLKEDKTNFRVFLFVTTSASIGIVSYFVDAPPVLPGISIFLGYYFWMVLCPIERVDRIQKLLRLS